ncbi:MAG: ATP-binding protein [bacterium]|nr:ATP-binding protein [bacterium]
MEAHKSRLKYSNIPKRYLDARLSDFSFEITKDIEKFIKCTGWASLLVLGSVGTGKTHLACAIAHEAARTRTILYTTLYGMSQKVMADMNDYSKKEKYKHRGAEIFQKVGILIIDEMGRSFATDAEKNRLFDIINYRYENLLPTVVLANKGKDELFHSIGEGVADRLRENMKGLVLTGKSWRK